MSLCLFISWKNALQTASSAELTIEIDAILTCVHFAEDTLNFFF